MSDRATAEVLDLIDAAIGDKDFGPDAVRYNAPIDLQQHSLAGPSAVRFEWIPTPRVVLPPERMRVLVEGFSQAAAELVRFSGAVAVQLGGFEMERLKRLLMRPPCRGGWDCLCHPQSFPAARDYRRRTKHRNRRRRT